jgi:chromosome segregation ATPase
VPKKAATDSTEAGRAAALSLLDETRAELERVREQLAERESELAAVNADLEALGLAHEAQARHLIIERLAVAENAAALLGEIDELKADVEWRKGVMKTYEEQLETLRNSRSLRYSASLRRVAGALRTRRP